MRMEPKILHDVFLVQTDSVEWLWQANTLKMFYRSLYFRPECMTVWDSSSRATPFRSMLAWMHSCSSVPMYLRVLTTRSLYNTMHDEFEMSVILSIVCIFMFFTVYASVIHIRILNYFLLLLLLLLFIYYCACTLCSRFAFFSVC